MSAESQVPLNERIKIIVGSLKMSQREFCLKAKLDPSPFNRVYHGNAIPRWDTVEAIYRAFPNINPHFLLSGEGNIFGSDQSGLEKCLAENEVLKDKLKDKEKIIALLESKR